MYIDIHILLSRSKFEQSIEKMMITVKRILTQNWENWRIEKKNYLSLKTNVSVLGVLSYFVDSVLHGSLKRIFTKFCSYVNVGYRGILKQKKKVQSKQEKPLK